MDQATYELHIQQAINACTHQRQVAWVERTVRNRPEKTTLWWRLEQANNHPELHRSIVRALATGGAEGKCFFFVCGRVFILF